VHFFFVETEGNLWKFLANTELEVRLTDGPNWESPLVAYASGFPLQYFREDVEVQS